VGYAVRKKGEGGTRHCLGACVVILTSPLLRAHFSPLSPWRLLPTHTHTTPFPFSLAPQASIAELNGLCVDLGWNQQGWGDWADSPQPHTSSPPGKFAAVRPILKLILLKVGVLAGVEVQSGLV
jgi:hypothetical protein